MLELFYVRVSKRFLGTNTEKTAHFFRNFLSLFYFFLELLAKWEYKAGKAE